MYKPHTRYLVHISPSLASAVHIILVTSLSPHVYIYVLTRLYIVCTLHQFLLFTQVCVYILSFIYSALVS